MYHVLSPTHVLLGDPDQPKLVSQENVATVRTPYSPLARAAGSYDNMLPSSGAVNERQVAMYEKYSEVVSRLI